MNKLIIIRGIPGSSKSTFARTMFPNIFHLENDMFHYHNGEYLWSAKKQPEAMSWCNEMCLLAMFRGMDVCISNTFTKRHYIDTYLNYAKMYGYDVEIYRMMGNFNNVHGLDEKLMNGFRKSIEDYPGEKFVYPVTVGENETAKYVICDVIKENN